ncbi:MAG: ArsR family transcriptional regulator [Caldilineaceae bacterium]
MHGVRKQILEILKERNSATVADLAALLAMPSVSVRHHLDILQGDNLIRVDHLERSGGAGRPQQVYTLTEEADNYFPNNFAALAGNLVRQMKQVLPPDQVETAFRNMAGEIAREFPPSSRNESLEQRLERITQFLNERGYLAHWYRDGASQSFFLQKCNCPYGEVAGEHRELCAMDQSLIDQLMGCHCERTRSARSGDGCCVYQICQDVQSSMPTLTQRSAIALLA